MIKYLLIFILLMSLDGLGLTKQIYSVNTTIGNVSVSLVVFTYLVTAFVLRLHKRSKVNFFDKLIKPYTLFLIYLILFSLKNLFIDHMGLAKIIYNFRSINMILFLYLLIGFIRTKKDFRFFLKSLVFISVISSLVIIFQSLTGIKTPGSTNVNYFATGIYRVWNYNIWLISIMAIHFFVKTLYKFNIKDFALFTLMLIAIYASLSRGAILGILLSIFITFMFKARYSMEKRMVRNIFFILIFFFLAVGYIISLTNYKPELLLQRIKEGNTKISENKDRRLNMMMEKITYLTLHEPLGVGFAFKIPKKDENVTKFSDIYYDPYSINSDATFQNIMLAAGIPGIILFILIFYKMFSGAKKIFIKSTNQDTKIIALTIIGASIIIFLYGFNGNLFSFQGFTIISILLGLTYFIKKGLSVNEA